MRPIVLITLSLLFGYHLSGGAEDTTKLQSFRELLLPQYASDFARADQTKTGALELSAQEKYSGLPADDKKAIMTNITAAWRGPLVLVHCGSKTELWGWNGETGATELLDAWDRHPAPLMLLPAPSSHLPCFFYLGDQLEINSSTVNLSLNARVGCFLLNDQWDCAGTFSYVFSGPNGGDSIYTINTFSFGIMGRRHFLIQNSNLSPSVGGQLLITSSGGDFTTTLSAVLGISWFLDAGSIDCDLTIGNKIGVMVGYTIAPNMEKR